MGNDTAALVKRLFDSDAASALTNEAARKIEAQDDTITTQAAEIARIKDEYNGLEIGAAIMKAENARLTGENSALAAWQCVFTDGVTGLTCDEYGGQFCQMLARAEKAEAALAAALARGNVLEVECQTLEIDTDVLKDERDAFAARVKVLEVALEPFVIISDEADQWGVPDNEIAEVTYGQCRESRAALKGETP